MTASAPAAGRKGLSLRAALAVLVAVGVVYVSSITVVLVFRILPAAQVLQERSAALIEFTPRLAQVDFMLTKAISDLHTLATMGRLGRLPPPGTVVTDPRGANPDKGARQVRERVEWLLETNVFIETSAAASQNPESRAVLAQALVTTTEATSYLLDAMASFQSGDYAGVYLPLGRADTLRMATADFLEDLTDIGIAEMNASRQSLTALADTVTRTVVAWLVAGVILLPIATLLVRDRFYRPLVELEAGLERVAEGDLTTELPVRRCDELGRLQAHFNEMTSVLRERADENERRRHNLSERLGRLLNESSHEIYVIDAETFRFVQVNKSARQNLGFTMTQLAELTPIDITAAATWEALDDLLRPLRERGIQRRHVSLNHRRADGSTYPVEVSIQYSPNEEPPVFVAVAQDMTERRRLEAERDRVFEASVDLLATATLDGFLTRVNPAFEKTLGYSKETLLTSHVLDFVHPDDVPGAKRQLRRVESREAVRNYEVRCRRADGAYRWLSFSCDPAEDGVVYAGARDVTEQKEAEAEQAALRDALERSAREWTVTFDTIDDPVLLVDDGGLVRRLNESARGLAGLPHRDVLGRSVASIGDSPLWEHVAEIAETTRKEGRPAATEVNGKGTGETWVVKANPVRAEDIGRGSVIVIAHDVTPLVRLRDSLRHSEAMAAMGSLVAGVAHEVRNPLFSMTATLDALEMRFGIREDSRKHVEVFRAQLDRMKQLMQELLDYGKPPTLDLECLPLEPVMKEAVEAHRALAKEQSVRIRIECEVGLPPMHMDRARLVQVFDNLVANAIQHTGIGGMVSVKAQLIRQHDRDWIETTVRDTGSGFAPEDLDHIFDPFFTRRPGGTGLGLALVQRIVEQHGGAIRAENRRQGGAAVRVRLPLLVGGVPVPT